MKMDLIKFQACCDSPATVNLFTVASMQWNGKDLTISYNNQLSIVIAVVLWLICKDKKNEKSGLVSSNSKCHHSANVADENPSNETLLLL